MFKKSNRLSTNFEFNITRKYGDHYEGKSHHMYILKPEKYEGPVKIGIIVSNKLHKKATKRNRVKRLFREAIRDTIKIDLKNLWIVVHPKFNVLNKSYEEICADINNTLQKASIAK